MKAAVEYIERDDGMTPFGKRWWIQIALAHVHASIACCAGIDMCCSSSAQVQLAMRGSSVITCVSQASSEAHLVVDAICILVQRTAVVQHAVARHAKARLFQRFDGANKLFLRAVVAVQVEIIVRHVALFADGRDRGREPDIGEAHLRKPLSLLHDVLVVLCAP